MKQLVLGLAALAMTIAAAAAPPAGEPDPALVDAIVRKLESSGALDRAVERALQRLSERAKEADRAAKEAEQARFQDRAKSARPPGAARDHIRGPAAAEVSLIEYSDFECPYCKRFHSTPAALLARFPGKVNWVYRHMPLQFHDPAARREAIASECAAMLGGNDGFWKYADALFEHTRSNGQGLPAEHSLEALAARQGIGKSAFASCLADGRAARRVEEDLAEGAKLGIRGTPTTLVRSNRSGATEVVVGAQPAEAVAAAVERLLGGKPGGNAAAK